MNPAPRIRLFHSIFIAAACLAFTGACRAETRPLRSVAVTVGDLGNPFFVQIARGAEAKARELGGPKVRFTAVSSDYDLNIQMNQMEDFIAGGIDLILLNAADSKGIAPAVKKARAAGITVVAVDVAAAGGVDATVMSDNVQAGRLGAEYIARRLGGRGDIVIINGPPVSANADRVAGADSVFRRYPAIRILSHDQNAGGSRVGGMNIMTDLLTANPRIDAVFAVNDPVGLGAALAVRQARRTGLFIVGVDGADDAVLALKDPASSFAATSAQDPFAMAARAVEIGYGLRQGRRPASTTELIPVTLVTRETVARYRGWSKQ